MSETDKLQEANNSIREEIDALHKKYEALKKFAIAKGIDYPSDR